MTLFEKKYPRFAQSDIGNRYMIWDADTNNFVGGVLTEIGDETVCFQWDDLEEDSEYQLSDLPLIIEEGSNTITNNPYYQGLAGIINQIKDGADVEGMVRQILTTYELELRTTPYAV